MKLVYSAHNNNLLRETLRTASKRAVSYSAARKVLPSLPLGRAISRSLGTNETIREDLGQAIDHLGVNQRALARRLGLHESRFSRWLNHKSDQPLSVVALDHYARYINDVIAWATAARAHLTETTQPSPIERPGTPPKSTGRSRG
jgi:hypothetical protein